MERRHWVIITSLLAMVVSLWVLTGLHSTAVRSQNSTMQEALEYAEKDLGLDDSLQQTLSGPARAMRVARATAAQAEAKQQQMEDLINQYNRMNMLDMGADPAMLDAWDQGESDQPPLNADGEIDWQKKIEQEHGLAGSR